MKYKELTYTKFLLALMACAPPTLAGPFTDFIDPLPGPSGLGLVAIGVVAAIILARLRK